MSFFNLNFLQTLVNKKNQFCFSFVRFFLHNFTFINSDFLFIPETQSDELLLSLKFLRWQNFAFKLDKSILEKDRSFICLFVFFS